MTKKKATKKPPDKQVKNRKKGGNLKLVSKPTQFKKGVSGNPGGRPRKEDCLTSIMRVKLEEVDPNDENKLTHAELVVLSTIELAKKGNAAALREVWERSDGKVTDKLDINPGKESPNAKLLAEVLSRRELKELHDRLTRASLS